MLKKSLAAALIVISSSAAFAADMPSRVAPAASPVAAPAFTWTGCYVGVHASGDFGRSNYGGLYRYNPGGVMGGAQMGCNTQINNFVIGAEAELAASAVRGGFTVPAGAMRQTSGLAGDIALRAGYAFDRTLVFGKVGWSLANHHYAISPANFTANHTHSGLLLGAGVEYALTDHVTLKGEYNYINYGTSNLKFYDSVGAYMGSAPHKNSENIFKVGLNYKF